MNKQSHTYKVVGRCRIMADAYGEFARRGRAPAILWIHGGALIAGRRGDVSPEQVERYVEAGYVLVSIDYRLAPETKLPAIISDVRDAMCWLRASGPDLFDIDPRRVAVVGHSAGGYLALMTGFCVDPRPSAIVSFYGYGDIAGDWYAKPDPFYCRTPPVSREEAYASVGGEVIAEALAPNLRHRFYLYCRQQWLWPNEVTGHDPARAPGAFDPFCPVRNVTGDYPPTLLVHGEKDTDVPFEQSAMMAEELARFGVEHELIAIPGAGHAFDVSDRERKAPAVTKAFDRVLAFLNEHIAADGCSQHGDTEHTENDLPRT